MPLIELDTNGDGLDLSDSEVVISDNVFEGFIDKGISIGENTKTLVIKNYFKSNRSAITAKDQSKVYLSENSYSQNNIQLEMYQKKLFFNHPSVFNINDKHTNSKILKTQRSNYFKLSDDNIKFDLLDLELFDKLESSKWVQYE